MEVTSELEDDFVDLTFSLVRLVNSPDGTHFTATGTHHEISLGFSVSLPEAALWAEGAFADTKTFQANIVISSLGTDSDSFISVLCELYGLPQKPKPMLPEVTFTAISLQGDPRVPSDAPVRLKLFFVPPEDSSEFDDRYAELYLNYSILHKRVYFHEKDIEYRDAVIAALTIPLKCAEQGAAANP